MGRRGLGCEYKVKEEGGGGGGKKGKEKKKGGETSEERGLGVWVILMD